VKPGLEIAAMLSEGRLADAIIHMTGKLRSAPTDSVSRATLAELLCLAGAFERAEAQLAILVHQTTDRAVAIARMRHLIRAAVAREAWYNDAAIPSLLGEPTPIHRSALELALAMRADDAATVARLLAAAEDNRPNVGGIVDGVAFDDMRDGDDRSAWFLDVLTHDGNYLWVAPDTVASIVFTPPRRPIDLLWREARMTLHDGRVADVVAPAQYVDPAAREAHRLAQATDWREVPGGAVCGTGQRMFLLGDEDRPILEITEIRLTPKVAA
jgi:type VI secretion system protein ImpE